MIEESATVVSRDGGLAWVETSRRSACGGCGHGRGCPSSVLGRLLTPDASNRLAVADDLGVHVGDRVVIGIPDRLLVRASAAAYLLPLAALVAAAGIAESLRAPELGVAAAGIAGLAVGLRLTGRLTGGAAARRRYQPVLLRLERPTLHVPFDTGAAGTARRHTTNDPTTEERR
jgi:sigma-E factor negative regulatory protein RseC